MTDEVYAEMSKESKMHYDELYNYYCPIVDDIINKQVKDIDLIEHVLDQVIEIYTEKGFYLFMKLLFYYSTVDLEKSYSYFDIISKNRSEEYEEYVKKIKQ